MADNIEDNQIPANKGASPEPPPEAQKKSRTVTFLVISVLLAAAVLGAYKLGWLSREFRPAGGSDIEKAPAASFTKVPESNLLSTAQLLEGVGKSPTDPSKVLFPSFDKPLAADGSQETPIACPTGPKEDRASGPIQGTPPAEQKEPQEASLPPVQREIEKDKGSPALVEKPVIVSREPGDQKVPEKNERVNETKGRPTKPEASGPTQESISTPRTSGATSKGPVAGRATEAPSVQKTAPEPDQSKEERYELPGSLSVRIKNYTGSTVKWGLMVILDDSASMGRKTKLWTAGRSEAAVNVLMKLPEALTPGSKLAIRDFTCGTSTKKGGFCLSHTLYGWSSSPFSELTDKLAAVKKEGRNNPCAAAAYAVKKDLGGLGELVPRILIVTNGQTKCSYHDVLKAIGSSGSTRKPIVDVMAVGMGPRNSRAYASLAKRTDGMFLRLDKPSEVDRVLGRYGLMLKTKAMEKLEVRGEKAVFTATPEEEITLAPGTYRVVLPLVGKLHPSHRSIPDVKINSGESKIIVVRIKNGRPVVRINKK